MSDNKISVETIFANSGSRIIYKGSEYKILNSGIYTDKSPFVELEPENEELAVRICEEISKEGRLTIRIRGHYCLVLGNDEYPYLR